ncbi:MAG: carnitine dehydratase [Deltaproteobacteria bacterium HGW-Deltaproteobacteria-12]|jgi:crotonobetainyl-CoA:carnitine CoA-transferase CaiB-like acyl-CoA transferase|nr:MAG: carnitine dehydratase [Deltaproteobacteria bacterium HGW-Deltaproteobacteria-12]
MPGPLKGLKILDFTTLLPGPFATMNLADLGAEVLNIRSGSRPDLTTLLPPFIPGTSLSVASAFLGRGKRSLTLNLKHPRAMTVVERLLATHDIIIEQFRPGVMEKLGFSYEQLRVQCPGLIYCSLTGYGQTGPMKDRAGHDINYLSRSGLMDYAGRREGGPVPFPMQLADVASGSYNSIIAILAAVISRQRTGEGQHLDISMTDGAIAFNAVVASAYLVTGEEPGREEYILNGGSLYDFYATSDGRYISFGGLEPQFFAAFCQAIGRPDLIPGGVAPADARVKEEIREIIRKKTREEWTAIFSGTDSCVEPVLSLAEVLNSDLVLEREMVVEVPMTEGKVRQMAHPVKYSATPPEYSSAGVKAGTHNTCILRELGFAAEEITMFEKTGLFS